MRGHEMPCAGDKAGVLRATSCLIGMIGRRQRRLEASTSNKTPLGGGDILSCLTTANELVDEGEETIELY
jgi:hypothetical protein